MNKKLLTPVLIRQLFLDCLGHTMLKHDALDRLSALIITAKAREYVFTGVGLCVCVCVCLSLSVCDHDN